MPRRFFTPACGKYSNAASVGWVVPHWNEKSRIEGRVGLASRSLMCSGQKFGQSCTLLVDTLYLGGEELKIGKEMIKKRKPPPARHVIH
jgi:hypothetical protein